METVQVSTTLFKPLENRNFAKSKPDTQVEGAAANAETKVDPWVHTRYAAVHTGCPPLLSKQSFKFHIFDHRIPCEFLRNSFTPRIRFVELILAKIEGVKL